MAKIKIVRVMVPGGQGPAGPQGPQGPIGPGGGDTGPQGPIGPQGNPGPQGPQGDLGPQGVQGPLGATGSQGAAGPQGATGSTGPQGPQGATGAQGATGSQGPIGPQGTTGATGTQGPQGATGGSGAQGATGPQGAAGPQGATGATGTQGPQGAAGGTGPQGATGPQGPQGPGVGDVVGPASSVNNNIAVFSGTTGKLIADGGATVASKADLTGAAFTGAVSATQLTANAGSIEVDRAGDVAAAFLALRADAGQTGACRLFSSGVAAGLRWEIGKFASAEGGSNAGSDFYLWSYSDTGTSVGRAFLVTRATRVVSFDVSPTAPTPSAADNSTKLATTQYVDTADAKGYQGVNNLTAASPTVVAAWYGCLNRLNSASAQTLALPADATLAVPIGTWMDFMQWNTGQTTFSAGSGATVNVQPTIAGVAVGLKTLRYGWIRAIKVLADTWVISGSGLTA